MAAARNRAAWARASGLMALIANAHRDPKKTRAFKPSDFDPTVRRQEVVVKGDITALRDVFVRGRKGRRKKRRAKETDAPPPQPPG